MARATIAKLKQFKQKAEAFLAEKGLGHQDDSRRPRWYRVAHFWLLVFKSFLRNRCPVRASALAYTTLLALIPMLAIAISVSSSLLKDEGEKPIQQLIDQFVANVAPSLNLETRTGDTNIAPTLPLTTNDITDAPLLLRQLGAGADPLSRYLTNRFSAALRQQMSPTAAPAPTNAASRLLLVQELNQVIQGETLYDPARFAGVNLSPRTLQLLQADATAADPMRLNRLLLEDAYPKAIARSFLDKRDEVVGKITGFIGNIRSGTLGVTSTIALVFVAIGLLRTIEAAFNHIWGVSRGRGWVASVIQYWAAITLGPLMLALALGMSSGPYFKSTARIIEQNAILGPLVLQLLPFGVIILGFTLLYQLMPNTRVRWGAALVGGLVGGCLWQMNNLFNVIYVSRVVTYSKIYGSLGVIPLFLIGLYFSWLILLFGAQVAYAYQNRQAYLQEKQAETISQRGREFVALRLMTQIARHFHGGKKPRTVDQLALGIGVPIRLASQILRVLMQANLVVEAINDDTGYLPARPLEKITAHDVLEAMRTNQGQELTTSQDAFRERVWQEFQRFYQAEKAVASTVTFEQLVQLPAHPTPDADAAAVSSNAAQT